MSNLNVHTIKVNKPDNLKIVIKFLKNPDLIIDTTRDQCLGVTFHGEKWQDLGFMFGQMFHFGSVQYIVHWDITFEITNNHALFETVQSHCCNFVLAYLYEDFCDIAIEGAPYFYLVTRGSDKTCCFLDISNGDDKVLVRSVRVVVFVVFVYWKRFATKD